MFCEPVAVINFNQSVILFILCFCPRLENRFFLVLWQPALFGAKPEIVVKGGQIAWSQMGKWVFS